MSKQQLDTVLGRSMSVSGGMEFRYNCPFCGDREFHLYVNYNVGKFLCWRGSCNVRGTVKYLCKRLGIEESSFSPQPTDALRRRLIGIKEAELKLESKEVERPEGLRVVPPGTYAYDYLVERGIGWEDIQQNELSVTPKDGFARIYFPDYDDRGRLRFWVARKYLTNTWGPKYVNASGSERTVYRASLVDRSQPVLVCEGPISAIVAGNAVATYGVRVKEEQVVELLGLGAPRYDIAFDGDAFEHSLKLAERLNSEGVSVRVVTMPDGEDPASLGRTLFQQQFWFDYTPGSTTPLRLRLNRS